MQKIQKLKKDLRKLTITQKKEKKRQSEKQKDYERSKLSLFKKQLKKVIGR